MSEVLITGGAGFIGSHLVDALISKGYSVRVLDNLSSGDYSFISRHEGDESFEFFKADLKVREDVEKAVKGVNTVFHFAANPEVRLSVQEPEVHFRENLISTFNLLEAVRKAGSVKVLAFASSSTVYGDAKVLPTPESYETRPISVYGASKAGCEALICSYAYLYGFKAVAFRYANIVGPRLRHGVIYDFIMKLRKKPARLEILGDGTQRKSYLFITDAVEATLFITERLKDFFKTFNIGNDDWITVREIGEIVSKVLGLKPKFVFAGGTKDGRGWLGDVKFMRLSIDRVKSLGWRPKYTSREAVELTAKALASELS